MQARQINLEVDLPSGQTIRLDVFLSQQLEELTRSRIQKLIDSGLVLLNGQPVKSGLKLKGREILTVTIPADSPTDVKPEDIPLDIVYEDEYLAVINKPAAMVTHPGAGIVQGTLVNALLHHCRESLSGISGVLRPGIVHRLDKDTSGLLVVAKEDRTHQGLSEQIRSKTARRQYTALLEGVLRHDSGVINKPIGRHPVHRKQMAIVEKGRTAVSHYQVLRRWTGFTLVSVLLETGRTHQIRVHMSDLGFPVVGDLVYNKKRTGTLAARAKLGLVGHALHASCLSFIHPITRGLLKFEIPLPPDFQNLVDSLKEG